MRARLESLAGGRRFYSARRAEYGTEDLLPFRVSPTPLFISSEQRAEINKIGVDIVDFVATSDALYKESDEVRHLLNRGKPEIFCDSYRPTNYLFVRPDLIVTDSGFTVCEVETSPFGLGLAHLLNTGYQQAGFETIVESTTLPDYVRRETSSAGEILYSRKTAAYSGQLTYLADSVFGREWTARSVDNHDPTNQLYRAFYLSEYMEDPQIRALLDDMADEDKNLLPSLTPHIEEKAVLALLWDRRWEGYYRRNLGEASYQHLRTVIPPSWIVGEEEHFAPGMPQGIQHSVDLATLAKSKRAFVLKTSGFHTQSSWGEGVTFLHKKSGTAVGSLLHGLSDEPDTLQIVQEFVKPRNIPMEYTEHGEVKPMRAKLRITPYFSMDGQLIGIKATGRQGSEYIHATTDSINTAVGVILPYENSNSGLETDSV